MVRQAARAAADDALTTPPVLTSGRPKDAATLLIVRRDGGAGTRGTEAAEPRVLMGRRHGGHAFMPGKWVFPGGGVDRTDFAVPAATELAGHIADALARTTTPARGRALAMAAIRETFEETGLLLAKPVDSALVKRTGPWRDFFAAGVAPDLAALDFVARAITPPVRPRRFDARFFMADAAALVSLDPGSGSGELDELAWFDWEAAAALDLPQITRAILAEVKLRLRDPTRPIPCHRFVRGRHRLEEI